MTQEMQIMLEDCRKLVAESEKALKRARANLDHANENYRTALAVLAKVEDGSGMSSEERDDASQTSDADADA